MLNILSTTCIDLQLWCNGQPARISKDLHWKHIYILILRIHDRLHSPLATMWSLTALELFISLCNNQSSRFRIQHLSIILWANLEAICRKKQKHNYAPALHVSPGLQRRFTSIREFTGKIMYGAFWSPAKTKHALAIRWRTPNNSKQTTNSPKHLKRNPLIFSQKSLVQPKPNFGMGCCKSTHQAPQTQPTHAPIKRTQLPVTVESHHLGSKLLVLLAVLQVLCFHVWARIMSFMQARIHR